MGGGSGQTTAGAHTMPNFIKTAAVAVAAALACAVAGAADFSAQTIRLAHTAAVSHAHHEAALQFAKNVSERTGGKVKVEVYPAGELGDQPALAEQVTLGALDSAVVSLGNLAMYSKKLNAMTAPFLFKDYDHAHRTIDAFVMPWMNEGLAQHDAVGLSMFDYGFRQTTTKGVPVNSAADLKGVKIRVPPATGLLAAFDAVGANTQKIAYSELYTSLKQGVVTGEENPVFTILADSLFETQDELALTNHYFDCQVLLFNKMFLEGLQPELQAILKEEAVKAQNLTRDRISHGEAAVIEELKKQEDDSYLISCSADLTDLFDLFKIKGECDSNTISGWVMEQIGRVPEEGDRFVSDGLDVTVTKVDHRRVLEIRVEVLPEETDNKK